MRKVNLKLKRLINLNSAIITCKCEDIDYDGQKEIIVGTLDNYLRIFKIENYNFSEIASIRNPSSITSIGCGDLDHNGTTEIFVAGRDKVLRIYNVYGEKLIEKGKHIFYDVIYDITIGDVFSNNVNELVVSAGKVISIFSYYGGELKEEGIIRQHHEVFEIKIADIDVDGKNDLIYGGRDNQVHLIQYESRFFQSVKASLKLGYYVLKLKTHINNTAKTSDIFIATADGKFQGHRLVGGIFHPIFSVTFKKNVRSFVISKFNDPEMIWIMCAGGSIVKLFSYKNDILELKSELNLSSSINSVNTIKFREDDDLYFVLGSEKGALMLYSVQ